MKSIKHILFSRRNIVGVLLGIAASLVFLSLVKNQVLGAILGMMVTLMIVDTRQTAELTILGLMTGSAAGLYWGARSYINSAEVPVNFTANDLITSMVSGLVWIGLICACYGFLLGKFFDFYKKGARIFF